MGTEELPDAGPIHVLAVTDGTGESGALARRLADTDGFEVVSVETVNDAVTRLTSHHDVECIVSDADTRDVDGVTFLQWVRVQDPDMPFFMVSSDDGDGIPARAMAARVTDYFVGEEFGDEEDRSIAMIERAVGYYRIRREDPDRLTRVRDVLDALPDMVAVVRDGVVEHLNAEAADFVGGGGLDAVVGQPLSDVLPDIGEDGERSLTSVQHGDRAVSRLEAELRDASDVRIPVVVTGARVLWEEEPAVLVVVRDVEQRRSLERRLDKVRRFETVIRDVDRAIINETSRDELEEEVCAILATADPYVMAWIGAVDGETGRVVPRAMAGDDEGYLDEIEVAVDDEALGAGPTGRAVATAEVQVVQDVATDEDYEPWRDEALEHDFRSSAAVPITWDGERFGVLSLYADVAGAFDAEEMALLEELGHDVAHALSAMSSRDALEERVKELRGIQAVAELLEREEHSLDDALAHFVDMIPSAFQHTDHTAVRIRVGDVEASSPAFAETDGERIHHEATTDDGRTVALDVVYTPDAPVEELGPFLEEEHDLVEVFVTLVTDYVDRRSYLEEVERVKERFRAYVENASDIVSVVDEDGVNQYVSPSAERILGYEPAELVGTVFMEIVHPDDTQEAVEAFDEVTETDGERVVRTETRVRHADGHWVWVETAAANRKAEEGFVLLTRDVTERKDRETQLRVTDRLLRHNLRNDASVIRGYAETIAEATSGEVAEHARTIVRTSDGLIDKADKQREIIEVLTEERPTERIDVAATVRRAVEHQRTAHPEATIALEAPDEATVTASARCGAAIEELIENAVVHSDRESPDVRVSVAVDGDVTVRVADDGPGIPEENVAVLEEGDETPLYHGSGVGLWLVHWIVRRSNATLEFEDNEPRGTVVTITMPRDDADVTATPSRKNAAPGRGER